MVPPAGRYHKHMGVAGLEEIAVPDRNWDKTQATHGRVFIRESVRIGIKVEKVG